MTVSGRTMLVKLAIIATMWAGTAVAEDGIIERTSSIVTAFLDNEEVLPTYNPFSIMQHRILTDHWLRGQPRVCVDACPWCMYWGPRYCQAGWIFKGRPVGTHWCAKTCNKCGAPAQGRTYRRSRETGGGANKSPMGASPATTGGGGDGDYATVLLNLVNQGRAENGASGLCLNSRLTAAGLGHCQDMAQRNYFAHNSEDGRSFDQRIRAAGYQSRGWLGENIAMGYTSPNDVYNGWKNSPGHWKNIIKKEFNQMGIAKVDSYWCQEFGQSDIESCD